jgi:hypothetical protein
MMSPHTYSNMSTNRNPSQAYGFAAPRDDLSRFTAYKHTSQELNDFAPEDDARNAEVNEAWYVVRAASFRDGEAGSDPAYWRRLDKATKLAAAPSARELTEAEDRGWRSLDRDHTFDVMNTQPLSHCAVIFQTNLLLAQNTQAVYRIAGLAESQPTLDQYWDARAERLAAVLDGLAELELHDSVAA